MATQRRVRLGRRPGNRDTRGEILAAAQKAFAKADSAAFHWGGIATDAGSGDSGSWPPSPVDGVRQINTRTGSYS